MCTYLKGSLPRTIFFALKTSRKILFSLEFCHSKIVKGNFEHMRYACELLRSLSKRKPMANGFQAINFNIWNWFILSFIYLFSVELIAFLYRNDSNVKSHYRKHSLTWHSRKRSKTKQNNGWTQLENRNRNCSTWVSFKTIVSIWCLVLYTHDWIRIKTLHENKTFSRNGLNWKHILKRKHHSSFYTSAGTHPWFVIVFKISFYQKCSTSFQFCIQNSIVYKSI